MLLVWKTLQYNDINIVDLTRQLVYTISMTFIDILLTKTVNDNPQIVNELLSQRDADVVKNLTQSMVGYQFITENQSRLLVKVLKRNTNQFIKFSPELVGMLDTPVWSKPFRVVEQVKRVYISGEDPSIVIEFTFSPSLRKTMTQTKVIEDLVQASNGKLYFAPLTESNIVAVVELLKPHKFEFSEQLQSHYDIIKSWTATDISDQFKLANMSSQNFHKQVAADIGELSTADPKIIYDRRIRYRYFPNEVIASDGTLASDIAMRTSNRVWINKNDHSLSSVFNALLQLKRAPIMVIFDNWSDDKAMGTLQELSNAIRDNSLDKVGIYFRMANSGSGIKFNEFISENQYNQYLDTDIQVVGVQSGKIPKFFLTSNWKPMSVVVLDTQLRSSKTAVFANCCDLIVTYTDTAPMIEKNDKWL